MASLKSVAERIESEGKLPQGSSERFGGYAVMALPFKSGHVLALRRWPATSIGPAYTSVWHRTPGGAWTIYADAPAEFSCARYFSDALQSAVHAPIALEWDDDRTFTVRVGGGVDLEWRISAAQTMVTRSLNAMSPMIPGPFWKQGWFLSPMGRMAGLMLRAGRIQLHGRVPNRQTFIANPRRMWIVRESRASLAGEDFGAPGPLPKQTRLGDFWLPQRGIVATASVFLESYDPARHARPDGQLLTNTSTAS